MIPNHTITLAPQAQMAKEFKIMYSHWATAYSNQ
jgi:hypothetical protein